MHMLLGVGLGLGFWVFFEFAFQVGSVCAIGIQTYLYLCRFTSSPDCWGSGENCGLFLFMLCLTWQPVLVPPAGQGYQGAAGPSTNRVLLTGSFWPGGSTACWDPAHFLHVVGLNGPVVLLLLQLHFKEY